MDLKVKAWIQQNSRQRAVKFTKSLNVSDSNIPRILNKAEGKTQPDSKSPNI